jgi:hypothetical protein
MNIYIYIWMHGTPWINFLFIFLWVALVVFGTFLYSYARYLHDLMLILFFIFVKKLIIMRLACMDFFIWGYIICSEVSCRHKLRLAHLFPLSENIIVSNELNMDIILSYKHEWLLFFGNGRCARGCMITWPQLYCTGFHSDRDVKEFQHRFFFKL